MTPQMLTWRTLCCVEVAQPQHTVLQLVFYLITNYPFATSRSLHRVVLCGEAVCVE